MSDSIPSDWLWPLHTPEQSGRPRFMVRSDDQWQAISNATFAQLTQRMTGFFTAAEIESGAHVGLYADNCLEGAVGAIGTLAAGCILVPLPASSTASQTAHIVEKWQLRALFVDSAERLRHLFTLWPRLSSLRMIVLLSDRLHPHQIAEEAAQQAPDGPDHIEIDARLATWSGAQAIGHAASLVHASTVKSRLTALDSQQIAVVVPQDGPSEQYTHAELFPGPVTTSTPSPQPARELLASPLAHISTLRSLYCGCYQGRTTWLSQPETLRRDLLEARPALLTTIPQAWQQLLETAHRDAGSTPAHDWLHEATGGELRAVHGVESTQNSLLQSTLRSCGIRVVSRQRDSSS